LAGAPIIQISTDYVFDGSLDRPYREDDPVSPLGAYGRSKLAGEKAVAAANPRHVILRTAWVYSPFGHNFVRTMLRLAGARDEFGVVDDQIGNPTSAFAIADAILVVARRLASKNADDAFGIYHFAGTGSASWFEFAGAIFDIAGPHLPKIPQVNAIATADYPTPAARPANSRLDTGLFEKTFAHSAPAWRDSLAETLSRLL
jgi:dTDP-4-dehydrorhamnose reductase